MTNNQTKELRHSLSVSIVSFAPAAAELARTLKSLAAAVSRAKIDALLGPVTLILVDNGRRECDRQLLRSLCRDQSIGAGFDNLKIISGHGNIGFGKGHNLALVAGGAELHLILNPDVRLEPEALSEACRFLEANPDVALLSPAAFWPDGSRQSLCKRYPSVLDLALRGFAPRFVRRVFKGRLVRYEMSDACSTEPFIGVPIASGCFMLARRGALTQVKGFSDDFFLYFEDFDLSLRLGTEGSIAYVPAVRIIHAGGHAARKGGRHLRWFADSALTFYSRHGWKLF